MIAGFTAEPVGRFVKKTLLNPSLTLPLLLLARFTARGQSIAQDHETAVKRIRLLFYLGLARWANRFLNRRALNNKVADQYDWIKEIVVVTGGSDGIGKQVVLMLAEKGVKVAVLDVQPLTYEPPPSVHYYNCDIRSPKAIAAAAAEIRSSFGEPTVLVNNAGVARGKTILDVTEADVRLTFDVNSLAHYWLVKEFLPSMVKTNHGMVFTVGSLAAYVSTANMFDYASSKAAALSFHEGLATELTTRYNAPKVRTVVVTPGFTRTSLFQGWNGKNNFMTPLLEVETVAEEIVKKILTGTSGQLVLPGSGNMIAVHMRSLPYWFQSSTRVKVDKMMRGVYARQVIDPEEKDAENP